MGRRAKQKCLFVLEKKEYRSAEKQLKGAEATAACKALWEGRVQGSTSATPS